MRADPGQTVSVQFSIVAHLYWGEIGEHTLKKEGSESMTTAYTITKNEIVFHTVAVEDSGTYIISCHNEAGEGSAKFELDVIPFQGI